MKNVLTSLVIIVCFVLAIGFFSSNTSVARTNTSLEITSEKSDIITVVRVLENGKYYLYIFCDGIFVNKMEDL